MSEEKKQIDLKFGFKKEKSTKPILEYFFDVKLVETENYHTFDYASIDGAPKPLMIELKSRRVKMNQYPSTMVGFNKIEKAVKLMKSENGGYQIYFVFDFDDCIAYYKFTRVIDSYKRKGGRRDRGKAEIKDYYYIPISKLTTIIKKKTVCQPTTHIALLFFRLKKPAAI